MPNRNNKDKNNLIVTIPLYLLYEVSISVVRWAEPTCPAAS